MKRLVFCFDGTWNRLDSICPTNVVLTAESTLPLASGNTAQLIYYHEGVGTGKWDRLRGGIFGAGLLQNLADAYRFLIFNYSIGDEIYIFGFSRGAFTARSFAGLLSNCGILFRRDAAKVKEAIARYQGRNNSPDFAEQMMQFRRDHSPEFCVSDAEDDWRTKNVVGYVRGNAPRLQIEYLGVWDTVGALGVPASFSWLSLANRKYQFHDVNLSTFVRSARHAVAIDERRKDFVPTLWANLPELNHLAGATPDDDDAPFQQKWFPGVHSSVGGGGERRGLSDQALDWILDGARRVGLELDTKEHSRIFELAPSYKEFLDNSAKQGVTYRFMNRFSAADRLPGPQQLFEVSLSAKRRWAERPENLSDKLAYRPPTLAGLSRDLDSIDPTSLGVGAATVSSADTENHEMYVVKPGDTLSAIAKHFYGSADTYRRIFLANRDTLENPDKIFAGMALRIPKD